MRETITMPPGKYFAGDILLNLKPSAFQLVVRNIIGKPTNMHTWHTTINNTPILGFRSFDGYGIYKDYSGLKYTESGLEYFTESGLFGVVPESLAQQSGDKFSYPTSRICQFSQEFECYADGNDLHFGDIRFSLVRNLRPEGSEKAGW